MMKTILESILEDTRPRYRAGGWSTTADAMAHISDLSISIIYKGSRPDLCEKFMKKNYGLNTAWSIEDDGLVIPLSKELCRDVTDLSEQFATAVAYSGMCWTDFEI